MHNYIVNATIQILPLAQDKHPYNKKCAEWICNLQIQIRTNGDMTGDEKMAKYHF